MRYEELLKAQEVFSLPERASLSEIKERHRTLVKRFHPDGGSADDEQIRQINDAYRILTRYCRQYRFSFSREEFYEQNPEERLREQFSQDPIWGK